MPSPVPAQSAPSPPTLPSLTDDLLALTRAVCDIPSVSGHEGPLADAVETALRAYPHLEVLRHGDAVVARTNLGRPRRVVVAGHLDTVPLATDPHTGEPNVPTRLVTGDATGPDAAPGDSPAPGAGDVLWGRGTVDMKAGVAVQLALAAELTDPVDDVTWVFYDHEEVDAALNGLGRLVRERPAWVRGDFAVLCEPTDGGIEGGCNGTLRVEVELRGVAAHSARSWRGENAIHAAAPVLTRLAEHVAQEREVDGLVYREGLLAVGISGGIAGNVVPDRCVVTVNFRFAPDRDVEAATAYVREVLDGFEVRVVDAAPGARPGLDAPAARAFVDAVSRHTGRAPTAKLGWTDVARFAELGVPAVNFGPGDPGLAHADDERVPVAQVHACHAALRAWLGNDDKGWA